MTIENNYGTHKDVNPMVTVNRARNILHANNIHVYEDHWRNFSGSIYSLHLTDIDIQKVGVNGKGVSKKYALASAYGEFMERLQNDVLYIKKYGNKKDASFRYPDTIYVTKEDLDSQRVNDYPLGKYLSDKMLVAPFYNFSRDEVEQIPYELITKLSTSNGMCAGNSPFEAISQGIGEVFERYIIRKIYFDKESFYHKVPREAYQNLSIFQEIEKIEESNYHVEVMDVTANGQFPVLGVIIYNEDRTKYKASFASDLVFETCIQRCVTEINQGGGTVENFEKRMLEISDKYQTEEERYKNFSLSLMCGNGFLPYQYVTTNRFNDFNWAFLHEVQSNELIFNEIVNHVKRLGYELLVRDVSFLGFPAFHVYIPTLSELKVHSPHKVIVNDNNKFNLLLKIPELNDAEIKDLINTLESKDFTAIYDINKTKYGDLVNIYIPKSLDIADLSVSILLVLLSNRVSDYNRCYKYLSLYLESKNEVENIEYFICSLEFFKLRSIRNDLNSIVNELKQKFDNFILNEVVKDLTDPKDSFAYYKFPVCSDDCEACPIEGFCYYPEWYKTIKSLNAAAKENMPDQLQLSNLSLVECGCIG